MPVFRTVDSGASTMVQSYEHRQLLHRARRYIYIKGAVNVVIAFLFLLTFPLELKPKMVAIALTDALFLVPYWFLVQRYPTLATGLSVGITSLAISAGDWVGGYQTGASGILYGLLILGGHLLDIWPHHRHLCGHHCPRGEWRNSHQLSLHLVQSISGGFSERHFNVRPDHPDWRGHETLS